MTTLSGPERRHGSGQPMKGSRVPRMKGVVVAVPAEINQVTSL